MPLFRDGAGHTEAGTAQQARGADPPIRLAGHASTVPEWACDLLAAQLSGHCQASLWTAGDAASIVDEILHNVPSQVSKPFIGSEALARGVMNRHRLRTQHRLLFPDVYLAKQIPASLDRRIEAAWLWTSREGVIADVAAAALHGAKWIDENVKIEIVHRNNRPPR